MPSLANLLLTALLLSPRVLGGVNLLRARWNVDAFLQHFVDDVSPDPSQRDLARFIDLAKHWCSNRSQQTAILQLSRLGLGRGPSRFPRLHRTRLTYQLIRRILDPNLFNQGKFGLCGPAAFTVTECRADPVSFARFAVHLFETGRGMLKGRQIVPAEQVLAFDPNPHGIAEADFLILASVLASDDTLTDRTNFAMYGGTSRPDMFDWFKAAGYKAVVMIWTPPSTGMLESLSYSFANRFQHQEYVLRCHPPNQAGAFGVQNLDPTDKLKVLQLACSYRQEGWKVMLSGFTGIAKAAPEFEEASQRRNDPDMPPGLANQMADRLQQLALEKLANTGEGHWMVAETLEIHGPLLRIRVWTWTRHYETANMPVDAFLNVFGGFVAAFPVPITQAPAMQNPFPQYVKKKTVSEV